MQGEALPLLVNRLDSTETIMPFDFYYFDFCEPGEDPLTGEHAPHVGAKVSENLGEVLLGERIRHSPYKVPPRVFVVIIFSFFLCFVCGRVRAQSNYREKKERERRVLFLFLLCVSVCE
jgi:hypothetical protein